MPNASEIKRKVGFILGDSSKLKAAFEFYPGWLFHLSLQELFVGNGAKLESHLHRGGCCRALGLTWHVQAGWNTVVAPGQGEPEPNPGSESLSSGKPKGETWEIPERDQTDPNLGSRPSSQHDKFYFQRIPEKHFVGFIFVVVWAFGVMLVEYFVFFFLNNSMAAFLYLLPPLQSMYGWTFFSLAGGR